MARDEVKTIAMEGPYLARDEIKILLNHSYNNPCNGEYLARDEVAMERYYLAKDKVKIIVNII